MNLEHSRTDLVRLFRVAQKLGHLGPEDVERHIDMALAHGEVGHVTAGERWADLGSGAGLPGLVIACAVDVEMVLIERSASRCDFLRSAIADLGLTERVVVVEDDVTTAARKPVYRSSFDGVCCRLFAAPAITAECAAGLLRLHGRLVVSEPPAGGGVRWDADAMAELGYGPVRYIAGPPGFVVVELERSVSDAIPRRWPAMKRRPRFT